MQTIVLMVFAEGRKRPVQMPWSAQFPPALGTSMVLPSFKKPHFKVEEHITVQHTGYGGLGTPPGFQRFSAPPVFMPSSGMGYPHQSYSIPPQTNTTEDEEDTSPVVETTPAAFTTVVVLRQCPQFDVPGLPSLSK